MGVDTEEPEETPTPTPEPKPEPKLAPPAPPAPPAFKFEDLTRAVADGFKNAIPAPPPPKPQHEWDGEDYWLAREGEDPKETNKKLHTRITAYAKHLIEEAVTPYKQRIDALEGGLNYIEFAKANDEKFVSSKDQILAIAKDEGISYKAAKRIWDAEQKATASVQTPPTAPVKPTPPASASHPKASALPDATKNKKYMKVSEIMAEGRAQGKIYNRS